MKIVKKCVKYGPLLLIAIVADALSFVVNHIAFVYNLIGSLLENQYQKAIKWCDSDD